MLKKFSLFTALLFTLLLIPAQALAAAAGGSEGYAEVSGAFYYGLAFLSFATIIFMIFLTIKDNG